MHTKTPHPPWLPRPGQHLRWDRVIEVGESAFRWHSRLDGSALLFGPEGKLAIGDTVTMPVGHMHGPGTPPPVFYVVTRIHEDGGGHAWVEAVRQVTP